MVEGIGKSTRIPSCRIYRDLGWLYTPARLVRFALYLSAYSFVILTYASLRRCSALRHGRSIIIMSQEKKVEEKPAYLV